MSPRPGAQRTRWGAVLAAIAARPDLWATALRQARRLSAPGWWRRPPFLPVPGGDYLRFRTVTQYGSADHPAEPADVVGYLDWCKRTERVRGRR